MINPTIGYEQQFIQFGTGNAILLTNPTSNISQFTVYHVDLSTGFSYKTFNYDYPGEITDLTDKNPTTQTTQFTLTAVDNSTGNIYNTFNYNYPNEVINLTDKNPTTNSSQFTLYPTDQETGKPYETFNYDYPGEITDLTDKNPTHPSSSAGVLLTKDYGSQPNKDNLISTDVSTGIGYKTFIFNYPNKPSGSLTNTTVLDSTNLNTAAFISQAYGAAGSVIGSIGGIPQISQAASATRNLATGNDSAAYSTLSFNKLKPYPGVKYSDFRSRKVWDLNDLQKLGQPRIDGLAASFRSSLGAIYATAAASPVGPYSIFNLDGYGKTGYGWGEQDNTDFPRVDYSLRSIAALKWKEGKWQSTINPIEVITPFRGDRVNVIDFKRSAQVKHAYVWKSDTNAERLYTTRDFIKFYLTGPTLQPGRVTSRDESPAGDDIIVFRATLNSLTDTFSPQWNPINMIGRADPNYYYGEYSRDISLDFTCYATDRDEVQPIWRKLNALAGYTAPIYDEGSIAMRAPWLRITIGDLFKQQPAIITSLAYTLHDTETTWETNMIEDEKMMQVPHKIDVSLGLTLITNELPQKDGRFYTLTSGDSFAPNGTATSGDANWLSDFKSVPVKTALDSKYLPSSTT